MVNLKNVKNRELMKVGKWQVFKGGEFNVTPELIKAAISAHESGVLRKPTIRLGHGDDDRFTGSPAMGWVDNVRASEDGTTLYGDLLGVPEWLADNMPSAYPSLSIEGMYDFTASDGTTHDFVLTGLALLGATMPGIGELKSVQDVEALYSGDIAAAIGEIGGTPVRLTAGIQIEAAEASEEKGAVVALSEQLAEALGIDASADEEAVLAKIAELKKPAPAPEPVEPQAEQVAAAASQLGLIMVDKDQYEATVAAAAAGQKAYEKQVADADESVVMAAIKDGRIPPARKAHWLGSLKSDREGFSQVLASLPKGLIPVVEAGHGIGSENVPEFDADLQRVEDRVFASLGIAKKAGSN
jgi:hypothetical protein